MGKNIIIKEDSIDAAVKVNATIVEFDRAYDRAHFEDRYGEKEKLILVAYVDDQPAGYMVSYDKKGDGSFHCWMAGVDPNFRRLGILRKMVEYMEGWAKARGYKKLTINTRNDRREMLSFLIKAGFNLIGVESRPDGNNKIFFERKID